MARSALLVGGSYDGLRLRLEGAALPLSITFDGETYDLNSGRHARYYSRRRTDWGRRRPFDAEAKRIVLRAVADGATVAQAAERAGFSVGPIYAALHRDERFRVHYAAAQRRKRSRSRRDSYLLHDRTCR